MPLEDTNNNKLARQLTLILSKRFLLVQPEEFWTDSEEAQTNLGSLEEGLFSIQAWSLEELNKGKKDNTLRVVFETLGRVAYHCAQDFSNWQAVYGMSERNAGKRLIFSLQASLMHSVSSQRKTCGHRWIPKSKSFIKIIATFSFPRISNNSTLTTCPSPRHACPTYLFIAIP